MGPDNFHLVFGTHGNCTKGYVLQTQWKGFRKSFVMTRANGERYMACPAFATLTFRSPNGRETVAYLRRKFFPVDLNSQHIAVRFGQPFEAPHGTCYKYKGWLGNHLDV